MKRQIWGLVIPTAFWICQGCSTKPHYDKNLNNLSVVNGDTLENGYWEYTISNNNVSKKGYFKNGIRSGEWLYKTNRDSQVFEWVIDTIGHDAFNIPRQFIRKKPKSPEIFLGDVDDGDPLTYLIVLRYDLDKQDASLNDYLIASYKAWRSDTTEYLVDKVGSRIYFRDINLVRLETKFKRGEKTYHAISYIFKVDKALYDLTYRNIDANFGGIEKEVLQDILYGSKIGGRDLFYYNNRRYLKEEPITFAEEEGT
ncbi:MAG: hypothetical protein ACK5DD_14080 [Cyclobacteriaceae bacterium]|jgi:hypothetical protein